MALQPPSLSQMCREPMCPMSWTPCCSTAKSSGLELFLKPQSAGSTDLP